MDPSHGAAAQAEAGTGPQQGGLPFQRAQHDAFRDGLAALREQHAVPAHPVSRIQAATRPGRSASESTRARMQADLYGAAFPARAAIEEQILARFGRLPGPGVPASSRLGLDALTGALDGFSFEAYLGLPFEPAEAQAPDMHSQMEVRLGLGADVTKPVRRGII
jgi:hypothetical protein